MTTLLISRAGDDTRQCEDELAELASDAGVCVLITPDIHHLADDSEVWDEIAQLSGRVAVVAAMHPRATEWTLRSHEPQIDELLAVDARECDTAAACWAQIEEWLAPGGDGQVRELVGEVGHRWYPVVDYSRCIGCRHCLQFCIFGVWDLDGKRVVTVAPDNCKAGCPACARICPQGAIIFAMSDEPDLAGAPGTLMQPDVMARRMYYARTEKRCPVCGCQGGVETLDGPDGAEVCEECGRPVETVADAPADTVVSDEIDALIGELDDMLGGGGQ